ncbi:MAG: hypothetical protein K2X74_16465 [Acetobacteraceae bacterium]|nr:hypothetical protein [Acetobacteraceae bacterium]
MLAGAVVAVAVGLTLNILGAAIGASVVDMTGRDTPDAQSFGIAGGIWLLVANLIGLGFGGYVAARLSGSAEEGDSVLHGLAVWAVAFLVAALLSGNAVSGAASTATQGATNLLGGAAQGAGQAVSALAGPAAERIDPRQLVERARTALSGGGDPAAMTSEQRGAEIAQLLTRRVTDRDLPPAERQRLVALVAAEYGVPPQEAERRLAQAEQQTTETLRTIEERARAAADAAATGAAVAAYWMFAALLFGAVAAVLGARLGTRAWVALRGGAMRRMPATT